MPVASSEFREEGRVWPRVADGICRKETGKRRRNKNAAALRIRTREARQNQTNAAAGSLVLWRIKKQMQIAPRYLERETRGTNHRRYLCFSAGRIKFNSAVWIAISVICETFLRNEVAANNYRIVSSVISGKFIASVSESRILGCSRHRNDRLIFHLSGIQMTHPAIVASPRDHCADVHTLIRACD